jgi:hypothetical protein
MAAGTAVAAAWAAVPVTAQAAAWVADLVLEPAVVLVDRAAVTVVAVADNLRADTSFIS